jgi:polysaccharide biosynthesis protein PslE
MLTSLSMRNIAHVIFRRRRTFLTMLLAPPLICTVVVTLQKKEYESSGQLMVKIIDQEVASPDMLADQQGRASMGATQLAKQIISSEILIITSGDVVKTALTRIGIERVYPDGPKKAAKARTPLLDWAAEKLTKDLTVKPNGETNILKLSVLNTDPGMAQLVLDNLIAVSMEKQANVLRDPRTDFLDRKLVVMKTESEDAKRNLLEFKRRTQITSFDEERSLLLRQRDGIEAQLGQSRADMLAAQGRTGALEGTLAATPEQVVLSDENDRAQRVLDQAQGRVATARARYENAQRRFTKDNPELLDLAADLRSAEQELASSSAVSQVRVRKGVNPVQQQIAGTLSTARSDANAQKNAVKERERQLEAINARLAYLDSNEIELRGLEQRQAIADGSYRSYLQRAESARIVRDMNEAGISGLSIVEAPTLPYEPAKPKKAFLIALSCIGGLIFGFGLCLLRESMDDTISLPEQLQEALGLPVLSSIKLKKIG